MKARYVSITMLCQTVLTAIAISYVICVLLLSGLQKEDLDENTLAKLRRHNVNIYDMNNESLRQECLKKSHVDTEKDKANEIAVVPNDNSEMSTKKSSGLLKQLTYSDDMRVEKQKTEMATPETYFIDKGNFRSFINNLKVKDAAHKELYNDDKVKISKIILNRPEDINITTNPEDTDQQIEYFKDHPSLDSVMKFWVKMTNKASSTVSTEATTTYSPYPTEQKVTSTAATVKVGNVRSKEMELINKIISEYLSSQSMPTTTQASSKNNKNMDLVFRKIKELLNKDTTTEYIPISTKVDNIYDKNVKEISDFAEFSKLFQTYNNGNDRAGKVVRTPQKVINDDIIDTKPYIDFTQKVTDVKADKKKQAMEYLSNMPNNKFRINGPTPFTELDTQDSRKNNYDEAIQGTHKIFEQHYIKNDTTNIQNRNIMKEKTDNVSTDFIKDIAEKVKALVMKDIRTEISTTERETLPLTATTTTTSSSTTAYTTTKETNVSNAIQTLMELVKEFKTMKEATKTTTYMPVKQKYNGETLTHNNAVPTHMYPPVIGGLNPFVVKTPVSNYKPLEVNPYSQNIAPMPLGPILQPPLQGPKLIPHTNFNQRFENQAPPITIQTNSDEIAPLLIKVSKAIKPVNQNIIVTTQNPFILQRDKRLHENNRQWLDLKYQKPLHVVDERNNRVENPKYDHLSNKLRILENNKQEITDSFKDRIQKIKDRVQHNRDKARESNRPSHTDFNYSSGGLVHTNQHVVPKIDFDHHSSQIDHSNRHDSLKRLLGSDRYEAFDRLPDRNHRETLNNHAELKHHQNHPADSRHRDVITREYLSRLGNLNRHDRLNEMVEYNPYMRRPIDLDQASRSHQSDAYEGYKHEMPHPRYRVPKYHEKLEQVENRPQNDYEDKGQNENCCKSVPDRAQMPLGKVKQYVRHDDLHFKNFMKSQQKVTDMLERMLAAKSKSKLQSGEDS